MSEPKAAAWVSCPNPRCDGSVLPEQKVCDTCGHELMACPSCGKLMSKTIGRCGGCGYRAAEKLAAATAASDAPALGREDIKPVSGPAASIPEASVVLFKPSRPDVVQAMASAYQQVALADGDMVTATRAFEDLRAAVLTEPDGLKTWQRFDDAIGTADTSLRPALITLRTWFGKQLCEQQRQRLGEAFKDDLEAGWREWLRTYAEGLARWRLLLCRDLVGAPLPYPDGFHEPYDFARFTRLILHERWPEVHQFFTFLASHEFLHPHTRARLLVPAGQIHLYWFSPRDQALAFFQQAGELAPGLALVLAATGDYYGEQDDLAKAQAYIEKALQAAPDQGDAYISMGNIAEKQSNLEEARGWFQEAINKAVGDRSGYARLLRLYGRPEFIDRYEAHIVPLAERAIAVSETSEYRTYIDVAAAYAASRRLDKVQEWYERAISLEPDRLEGYIERGFAYMQEGENRYQDAYAAFQKALEVAPESYSGSWGMGQLAERRGQWAEAAAWYAKALQAQPEYYSNLRSRIGEMYWKMEEFAQAEAALLDALAQDRSNDAVVLELADDYYRKQHKPEAALRLFREVREIKGEEFEAGYQNRVGNVYYYENEYEKSVPYYLNAIRLDPGQAVYLENLSGAYRGLERWSEACEYLKRAYALHGDRQQYESKLARVFDDEARSLEKSLPALANALEKLDAALARVRGELEQAQVKEPFSEHLARLEQMRAFVVRYGARALAFSPVEKPIQVRADSAVLSFILNTDQTDLSKAFVDHVVAMRERLRNHYGMFIPGLNFTELDEPDLQSGSYRVEVMSELVGHGRLSIDEESDPTEPFLEHLECALSSHLDKLCGHQATASLLAQCDTKDCAEIRGDPRKLHALTQRLNALLKKGQTITNLAAIAAETNAADVAGTNEGEKPRAERQEETLASGITALTLYLDKSGPRPLDSVGLAEKFAELQKQLFEELGVIAPQIAFADSQVDSQLQINDELLPIHSGAEPFEWVGAELRSRAEHLLTTDLMEYYLTKIKADFPALVNVACHYFSVGEMVHELRRRLRRQSSIKDLPRVLEEVIDAAGDRFGEPSAAPGPDGAPGGP